MERERYYITTPIYYVTAKPHLGSLYSTLLADVLARWQKLLGKKVMFVTGTDEHGQKVAQAARTQNSEPQLFVDQFIPAFKQAWQTYGISNDFFVRTTDKKHIHGAQEFIKRLIKNEAIYTSLYEGWYCTPCETFVTETAVAAAVDEGKKDGLVLGPPCSSCQRETHFLAEETYFFKLSAYQDKLLQFFTDNPDFIIPRERAQEVISFVKDGLRDLSISRTSVSWGVPFPDDEKHTVYVWIEALCNYITAIGYPTDPELFATWWPADMQVLGKDIIRFHAVYWPALLMAAEMPLPKQLLVHGWIKVNNQKMSKSLQNVVDPMELYAMYGADAVRYYLVRYMAINQDGEFSRADLEQKITSELANDLGNLLQRMTLLALKSVDTVSSGAVSSGQGVLYTIDAPEIWSSEALELRSQLWDIIGEYNQYMQEALFHMALSRVWHFIHKVNAYFHATSPWKIKDKKSAEFKEIISATAHSLHAIAILLWPVMPEKMEILLAGIGVSFDIRQSEHIDILNNLALDTWQHSFVLQKIEPLFAKFDIILENSAQDLNVTENNKNKEKNKLVSDETKTMNKENLATDTAINTVADAIPVVQFEDFARVALVVGTIVACEPVEVSEKLLKMQVDFGPKGKRQILAGVKKFYAPEDLIGKQSVFVFNLSPRKMAGLASQGMMLMADSADGIPSMTTIAQSVPNGTRLK